MVDLLRLATMLSLRVLAGTAHRFEEAEVRAFIEIDHDRAGGYLSATNHGAFMAQRTRFTRSTTADWDTIIGAIATHTRWKPAD